MLQYTRSQSLEEDEEEEEEGNGVVGDTGNGGERYFQIRLLGWTKEIH